MRSDFVRPIEARLNLNNLRTNKITDGSKYERKKMDTLIVQLIFIIIGFIAVAFVASLFLRKKKDNYVPESDVINDSDYNIESIEAEEQSEGSEQKKDEVS